MPFLPTSGGANLVLAGPSAAPAGNVQLRALVDSDLPSSINPSSIGATTPGAGAFTTLTASGNVGIGTTGPGDKLVVLGANSNTGLEFGNNTGGAGTIQVYDRVASAYKEFDINSSMTVLNAPVATNTWMALALGVNVTGQSYGMYIQAGTNSSDYSFGVENRGGSAWYLLIRGDGLVQMQHYGAGTATFDASGNISSVSGYTGTITTAKLTPGGSNGSMTFVNGVLTAQTAAT